MKKYILLFLTISFFAGCASPFAKHYKDKTGGTDITANPNVMISQKKPKLFHGTITKQKEEYWHMIEEGYGLIGTNSFSAGKVDMEEALAHAEEKHASIVIVYTKYKKTISGSIPLVIPVSKNKLATIDIPYNVDRYDYFMTYWIKLKPHAFGLAVKELTPQMRKHFGSNKGVLVVSVVKHTPAFYADIFIGDIIRSIGDTYVYDPKGFVQTVAKFAGQRVIVGIFRDGEEIQKEIQLGQKR